MITPPITHPNNLVYPGTPKPSRKRNRSCEISIPPLILTSTTILPSTSHTISNSTNSTLDATLNANMNALRARLLTVQNSENIQPLTSQTVTNLTHNNANTNTSTLHRPIAQRPSHSTLPR